MKELEELEALQKLHESDNENEGDQEIENDNDDIQPIAAAVSSTSPLADRGGDSPDDDMTAIVVDSTSGEVSEAAATGGWICSKCTMENPESKRKCIVCMSKKS